MFKSTKIVATIGPASASKEMIAKMARHGLNAARLTFAHGTHEAHAAAARLIRAVEKEQGRPLTIIQDLPGPKIRIGAMPEKGVPIKTGETVVVDTSLSEYNGVAIPLDYPGLHKFFKIGDRIFLDDGHAEIKVEKIAGARLYCRVIEGHVIKSHKGFNLPDTHVDVPVLSAKDKDDLKFGIKLGVDMVAISFVHSAQDIKGVRAVIKKFEKELKLKPVQPLQIISKIERHEAIANMEEIVEESDAIMVARGDLAQDINLEELPLAQKRLIDMCNAKATPVIVATQMLDSMQTENRPTRAEITDVANAVIDHADALMLSAESAVGEHPDLVVKTMAKIIKATEKSAYDDMNLPPVHKKGAPAYLAITEVSRILADEVDAKLILAASLTGETGRLISHVRPELPILVATDNERSWRQLNLSWGVQPFILPRCHSVEELVRLSLQYIKNKRLAKKGDKIIVVAGDPVGQAGNVNLVEVREVK